MYRVYNVRTGRTEFISLRWWEALIYLIVNYGEDHPEKDYVRYEELGDGLLG